MVRLPIFGAKWFGWLQFSRARHVIKVFAPERIHIDLQRFANFTSCHESALTDLQYFLLDSGSMRGFSGLDIDSADPTTSPIFFHVLPPLIFQSQHLASAEVKKYATPICLKDGFTYKYAIEDSTEFGAYGQQFEH
ncbi:MAG: hypothetical protein AABM64_11115 [Pseudomonadota bacterium]